MIYKQIGQSDLKASVVSLGTWAIGGGSWWGQNDDNESIKTIHEAIAEGINLVDTAPVYGFGHSEEVVGKAIKDRRSNVLVSTKCGLRWTDQEGSYYFSRDGRDVYKNVSKKAIKDDVEMSLRRLGTDYIDVYFTHWQSVEPFLVPVSETMEALNELKKEGKIRAIGASNVTPWHIEEYVKYGQLDIIQEKYSLIDRRIEEELLPLAKKHNITFQAYSPLEQGLLTGKMKKDYVPEVNSARYGKKWYQPENLAKVVNMVEGWQDLCKKYSCTPTHLVIAWLLAQGDNVNVLCGARKTEQLEDNIKGADIILDAADTARMREDALAL
ncbi:aldo/keto reductase [Cellulosilyticum sp. I15G10I2]|uniref:aldo/keto reductase n=1 Tax=Cellulosilyticum sp. I15G10I2 TaxID=1892843 RepID=UPI00085C6187|nr:aldo/keto reductase [Cellulosilyticum sp. I15G10I2]